MSRLVRRLRARLLAGLRRRERVVPVVTRVTRRRWERAAPEDWAATLHLLYLRHRHRHLPRYFAKFHAYPTPRNRFTRAWRWYFSDVLVQAAKLLRRNARQVRASAGVPVRRQAWEILALSVSLPSMPENYYKFELFRPEQRARAGDYLHRHETKGALYEMLSEVAGLPDLDRAAPLNDKVAFAAHARAAGLPVAATVAVIVDGVVVEQAAALPAADLFVKPLAGKGGRGAQRWRYLRGPERFRNGEQEVAPAGLLSLLADRSAGGGQLVQPCLTNHPDLVDLALDAVPTCRIITITDERGEPEPVIAIFRMPAVPDAIVDNLHRGGLAAPVELESGLLGPATGYSGVRHTRHPVTGGAIDGRKLPGWQQVRALACRAHQGFRPRLLVGWDICLSPTGPVLVEGNEQPGVDGLQRLHDVALGSHRFAELLAHHLTARYGR